MTEALPTKVVIGIQARSTSTRFPNKIHEKIGRRTCLEHVIEACLKSALYLNNWNGKQLEVQTVLLIPYGDETKKKLPKEMPIIEGPEDDVLSRYALLCEKYKPEYVVRITADCPLIPHFLITKLVNLAVMNEYDYVSNVDERVRTSIDGYDCEVLSQKALIYLHMNAYEVKDREHVTTYLRSHPPGWLTQGVVLNFLDYSEIKLSNDTPSDLKRIKGEYMRVDKKLERAINIFGKAQVHRF